MDAATLGVLRDVAILVWMALMFGMGAYRIERTLRPALSWNRRGRVWAGSFRLVDAVVVASIMAVLLANLMDVDAQGSGAGAASSSSAAETAGASDGGAGGGSGTDADSGGMELSVGLLLKNAVFFLGLCVVVLFYLRVVRGLNPAELFGLRRQGILKALLMAVVFIVPTILVVNVSAYSITEWMKGFWPNVGAQDLVQGFGKSDDVAAKGLMVFTAVVLAPLGEEILFRGFLYGVVKRFSDGYFAALVSALLFGLIHYHLGSMVPLVLLSLVFCMAYELSGSLLVPMLMHSFFNATSVAMMIFSGERG